MDSGRVQQDRRQRFRHVEIVFLQNDGLQEALDRRLFFEC